MIVSSRYLVDSPIRFVQYNQGALKHGRGKRSYIALIYCALALIHV
jgi:hypothetical protein